MHDGHPREVAIGDQLGRDRHPPVEGVLGVALALQVAGRLGDCPCRTELAEGPCLTAWAGSVLTRIDDLEVDERWPRWAEAARGLHLRSVLSTPVVGTVRNLGAIKVYSERPTAFDRAAEDLLLRLADQAAILLENLQSLSEAEQSSTAVMAALEVRQQVAMAQGVLMGRHGLTQEQAFLRLSEDAARHRQTVAEEAADLVGTR